MEENKRIQELKSEDKEEEIRRKQYIQDRDNMKLKYYKNLNIK
ncbi:hypothetical protein U729_2989 [Clostridium baratii str. Sullivan]|uniref:Uncharacterized protein n=1 Tax=Clostridium baratii str. Sullivan TaxID=1415775 RepID=A0A0A7FX94_9CLOT|nr:hypothetical protein [Clostridium baratii]AIY84222.1 hypothetical protein U729_2989 [Clostridium baratii str. Sullivan]